MKISTVAMSICATLCIASGNSARGITIRDDRSDSQYTAYANNSFPSGGVLSGAWIGSGTLISPTWILTAAHVLDGVSTFQSTAGNIGVVETVSYPGLDLGLARLASPITSIEPTKLYDLDFGIEDSQECIILGGGNTGTGLSGQIGGSAGTRRAADTYVYANASAWGWGSEKLLTWFRTPSGGAANLEGGGAQGDSGGGLLLNVEGEYAIAGVMSQAWSGGSGGAIIGQYNTGGVYVRSAPLNNWILQYATDATIISTNDPPTAVDDFYGVNEDSTLHIVPSGVLLNDTDPDNDPLTALKVSGPEHGTLTFNSNGSFDYTPHSDWHGTDTFTYKALDGTDESNEATVSVVVDSVLDVPNITLGLTDNGFVGNGLHSYTLTATGIGITSLSQFTVDGAVHQVFNAGAQTDWLGDGSATDTESSDSYVIFGDMRIPDLGGASWDYVNYPQGPPEKVTAESITDGGDSGMGTLNNSDNGPAFYDVYTKLGTPATEAETVELLQLVLDEGKGFEASVKLLAAMAYGVTGPGESDISIHELTYSLAALIPGDINGDGHVNSTDAGILASNWLKTSDASWGDGDFNRDGMVNDIDAAILAANWQVAGTQASVPEPSTVTMLILSVLCLASYRIERNGASHRFF